eukprot:s589_g14.t3
MDAMDLPFAKSQVSDLIRVLKLYWSKQTCDLDIKKGAPLANVRKALNRIANLARSSAPQRAEWKAADAPRKSSRAMAFKDGLVKLKAFAAAWWFPVLVGILSGANLFLLVMSAPLVILYCSAVLANPKRWLYTAIANAVGTVLGCLVLVILMEERGMDFIKESFPSTFTSFPNAQAFNLHAWSRYGSCLVIEKGK